MHKEDPLKEHHKGIVHPCRGCRVDNLAKLQTAKDNLAKMQTAKDNLLILVNSERGAGCSRVLKGRPHLNMGGRRAAL